jgi:hypothetical protein
MIVYHAAFDLYNCMFRLLLILSRIKEEEVEMERMLIWDYYVAFPNRVSQISFPQEMKAQYAKFFKENNNPYDEVLDDVKVFSRMRSYQTEALRCLAAYGLIDAEQLLNSRVKRTSKPLPSVLQERISEVPNRLRNVITLIESPFTELPLYGAKGFKFRTKLIDYKYDVQ